MSYLAHETLAQLQHLTRVYRANVLIVGDLPSSHRGELLGSVKLHSRFEVVHAQRPFALALPNHGELILVLDDVCELSLDDQGRLLEWISRHDSQIVSFASCSPYDMLHEGRFLDQLYYRLNTFCILLRDG